MDTQGTPMTDRQLIEDLLSALEYHTEQTRPIEFSKVAIQAAREYLQKPAQQEPVAWAKQTDKKLRIALNMQDMDGWRPLVYGDTSPPAQRKPLTDDFLQQSDYHLLHSFIETTEDDEGYVIGKKEIKRLAELGVVQSHGFGKYSVTMFGYWVHERYWEQNPSLPLKTNADRVIEAKLKEKNT